MAVSSIRLSLDLQFTLNFSFEKSHCELRGKAFNALNETIRAGHDGSQGNVLKYNATIDEIVETFSAVRGIQVGKNSASLLLRSLLRDERVGSVFGATLRSLASSFRTVCLIFTTKLTRPSTGFSKLL